MMMASLWVAIVLALLALLCLVSLPEECSAPRGSTPPDVPPSPLAEPSPSGPGPDVALPWTTPIATALAALVGESAMVVYEVYVGYVQPAMVGGMALCIVDDVLASALRGLGAAVADRIRPLWPCWARWTVGIAVASAIPGPLEVRTAIGRGLVPAMQATSPHIVWGAAIGLVFGLVARGRHGLLWKLALAGFAVELAWSTANGALGWTVHSVISGQMAHLGMSLLALALPCFWLAAMGFAFGERLTAARRKALEEH